MARLSLSLMLFTTIWMPAMVVWRLTLALVTVAAALRVKVVVLTTLATVALAGIPVPAPTLKTFIPTARPTVLKQVTVVRLEAGKVVLDYAPAVR